MKSIIAKLNMDSYKSVESKFNFGGTDIVAKFLNLTKRNFISITNLTYSTVSNIRAVISKIIRPATNTAIATDSCTAEVRQKRTLAYFNGKTFADIKTKQMQEIVYEIIS